MTIDPSDPEVFEADDPAELEPETPEAGGAEQHTDVRSEHDDPLPQGNPDGANAADVAEQARVVPLDEDDDS